METAGTVVICAVVVEVRISVAVEVTAVVAVEAVTAVVYAAEAEVAADVFEAAVAAVVESEELCYVIRAASVVLTAEVVRTVEVTVFVLSELGSVVIAALTVLVSMMMPLPEGAGFSGVLSILVDTPMTITAAVPKVRAAVRRKMSDLRRFFSAIILSPRFISPAAHFSYLSIIRPPLQLCFQGFFRIVYQVSDLLRVLSHYFGYLRVRELLKVNEVENLRIFSLQYLESAVNKEILFILYAVCFNVLFICNIEAVLNRSIIRPTDLFQVV